MSVKASIERLGLVQDLRRRDVDRIGVEMAGQERVRQRYQRNLDRLEQLCADSGASGLQVPQGAPRTLSAALASNCAGYKQSVMKMADAHRVDLALHESDMTNTRLRMLEATRRREALDSVVEARRETLRRDGVRREQKGQDELASQQWTRGRR
jgi:flagellar export protein FliJ